MRFVPPTIRMRVSWSLLARAMERCYCLSKRMAEIQRPDLVVIELLTGLTNGDIPLKIHITATFGSNTSMQNLNLEPNPAWTFASASIPPPTAAPLQFPCNSQLHRLWGLRRYLSIPCRPPQRTEPLVGWSVGTAGNHAVRNLEVKFQHRWRPTTKT
jgi:hypothetical protein